MKVFKASVCLTLSFFSLAMLFSVSAQAQPGNKDVAPSGGAIDGGGIIYNVNFETCTGTLNNGNAITFKVDAILDPGNYVGSLSYPNKEVVLFACKKVNSKKHAGGDQTNVIWSCSESDIDGVANKGRSAEINSAGFAGVKTGSIKGKKDRFLANLVCPTVLTVQ